MSSASRVLSGSDLRNIDSDIFQDNAALRILKLLSWKETTEGPTYLPPGFMLFKPKVR